MRNHGSLRIYDVAGPPLSPLCASEQPSIADSAIFWMRKLKLRDVKYLSKVTQLRKGVVRIQTQKC